MTHNERDFRTVIILALALTFTIALGLMSSNANAVPPPIMHYVQDGWQCWYVKERGGYMCSPQMPKVKLREWKGVTTK